MRVSLQSVERIRYCGRQEPGNAPAPQRAAGCAWGCSLLDFAAAMAVECSMIACTNALLYNG
jgi:hypothetical protein